MTEEENKAIEVLEKYKFSEREEYLENNAKKIGKKYEDLYLERTWIPTTYERKQFTIVYNLIEKLKKENHDLNNKVWLYTDKYNDMVISNGKYLDKLIKLEKNSIPKDKIREKIEPKLNKLKEEMNKEFDMYGKSSEYLNLDEQYNFLYEIKELLEEE